MVVWPMMMGEDGRKEKNREVPRGKSERVREKDRGKVKMRMKN